MFKIGDPVKQIGGDEIGEIVTIVGDIALVKFRKSKKKIPLAELVSPLKGSICLTPETFDYAVKELMYEAAADYGKEDANDLDGILEVIGVISASLKRRLFETND